jgi:hypothetical protein
MNYWQTPGCATGFSEPTTKINITTHTLHYLLTNALFSQYDHSCKSTAMASPTVSAILVISTSYISFVL